jgi:hypothetical protein
MMQVQLSRPLLVSCGSVVALLGLALLTWRQQQQQPKRKNDNDDDNNTNTTRDAPEDASSSEPNTSKQTIPPLPDHVQRELYKEERRQKMAPVLAMKKPMYDNILMKDPGGETLCTISHKKANWYINKNLATWDEAKTTIRLTFKPNKKTKRATANGDDDVNNKNNDNDDSTQYDSPNVYNQSLKENCCVVCGAEKDYRRHYVVPYCYRARFPKRFKTHMPHDVVILCPNCHVRAQQASHDRMQVLEGKLRAQYFDDPAYAELSAQPSINNLALYQVRSAACALLRWKNQLPADKVVEYSELVRQHYLLTGDDQELSNDCLKEASRLEARRPNPDYVTESDLVARHLQETNKEDQTEIITAFVKEWRELFCDEMQPRHLPVGWRIDAPVMCDRGNDEQEDGS